ncbi:hypothetical protein KY343_05415 [Candidatus Woesearchaeota archaeon]|nr:hypothetical protein [Candidatus Woesearchaeota archaeon]
MESFNFIDIEDKKYPAVILGGDRFLGWFGTKEELKDKITTESYIVSIMNKSYELGVRGFDMSVKAEVINSFKTIKKKYPEVVGIGNPNWRCGVNLNYKPLMKFPNKIVSTMYQDYFSDKIKGDISKLPYPSTKWFAKVDEKPLTKKEIYSINIDLDIFQEKLDVLKEVCDFCLIGPNPIDCLIIMDRLDIIEKMIKRVRENDMIPISLAHLTSLSIPKLRKIDFALYWTWINKEFQFSNENDAFRAIQDAKKPTTAMKVFAGGRLANDIEGCIRYLKKRGINSFNLGIETEQQAQETFSIVHKSDSFI